MDSFPAGWMALVVGVFGAIVGSFLNVCIVRIPRGESIVTPRSRCATCRQSLAWWENIPLVSFLFLRGRCRSCGRRISWRYPAVELLTALLSLAAWWKFGATLEYALSFLLLLSPLVVIAFIDLEHLIIPDVISLPGIAVGCGVHLLLAPEGGRSAAFWESFLGAVVGGGFLFVVAWVYEKLKHQEGMGGGDVKLAALLGSFFGWQAAIFILMISSVLGSVVGILCVTLGKKDLKFAIPFGPFLVIAGMLHLFYGDQIIGWYLAHLTIAFSGLR